MQVGKPSQSGFIRYHDFHQHRPSALPVFDTIDGMDRQPWYILLAFLRFCASFDSGERNEKPLKFPSLFYFLLKEYHNQEVRVGKSEKERVMANKTLAYTCRATMSFWSGFMTLYWRRKQSIMCVGIPMVLILKIFPPQGLPTSCSWNMFTIGHTIRANVKILESYLIIEYFKAFFTVYRLGKLFNQACCVKQHEQNKVLKPECNRKINAFVFSNSKTLSNVSDLREVSLSWIAINDKERSLQKNKYIKETRLPLKKNNLNYNRG